MAKGLSEEALAEKAERVRRRDRALLYLKHVRGLRARVKSLEREIDLQREMLDGVKSVSFGERVSGPGVNKDAIPDSISRLHELIKEYCNELPEYVDAHKEAHAIIKKLPHKDRAAVLSQRFLVGRSLFETAADLGYKPGEVNALEGEGLQELHEFLPPEWRLKEAEGGDDFLEMTRDVRVELMRL